MELVKNSAVSAVSQATAKMIRPTLRRMDFWKFLDRRLEDAFLLFPSLLFLRHLLRRNYCSFWNICNGILIMVDVGLFRCAHDNTAQVKFSFVRFLCILVGWFLISSYQLLNAYFSLLQMCVWLTPNFPNCIGQIFYFIKWVEKRTFKGRPGGNGKISLSLIITKDNVGPDRPDRPDIIFS